MTASATPQHFTYVDAEGVEISAYEWAAEDPIGIVQISHGVGEHALRYDAFARALVEVGFTVFADDHRGHGATGLRQHRGEHAKLGKLGAGGLRATEAAVLQLTQSLRSRFPGLPIVLFAHSWGSLMAQRLLNSHPRTWDAVVLSGTAYRTPRHLESGKLNAHWDAPDASGFEWLSRDPEVARRFAADPLCFPADVLRLFGVADALRLYGTPRKGAVTDTPVLIIAGADDPLSRGDGLRKLADAYRAAGARDITLKRYPGARHEILNETNRDEVTQDIVTWILERVTED